MKYKYTIKCASMSTQECFCLAEKAVIVIVCITVFLIVPVKINSNEQSQASFPWHAPGMTPFFTLQPSSTIVFPQFQTLVDKLKLSFLLFPPIYCRRWVLQELLYRRFVGWNRRIVAQHLGSVKGLDFHLMMMMMACLSFLLIDNK